MYLRRLVCSSLVFMCISAGAAEDEYVVVSASPVEQGEGTISLAVSKLATEDLTSLDVTHPNELGALVPGAWVSRGDGQEHLTAIRSPIFTGAGACGAFIIAEDSIPVRAPGFCNINQLLDTHYELAESIEIFRGPSSTVFGSNGLFGGINVISPSNDRLNELSLEYGSNDFKRFNFNYLTPSKSKHVYASVTDTGSFREQAGYKQQKLGLKSYSSRNEWTSESVVRVNNFEQETAGYIEGFESYLSDDARSQNIFPEAYRDAQSIRAHSTWRRDQTASSLVVQPYLRVHRMEFLMHFVPWQPVETNQHESVGLRAFHHSEIDENLSFTKGVDIDVTNGKLEEFQESPAPFAQQNFPEGTHYDYRVLSSNLSPFVELKYRAREHVLLNAQLRWESVRYDYENLTDDGSACDETATACRFFRPESKVDSFDSLSWRFGALAPIASSSSIYANVASAYRAPQTTELYRAQSPLDQDLSPVKVDGIEFGFRRRSDRYSLDINLYAMKQYDAIYQNSDRQYLVGAESSHRGLEYDIRIELSESLSFSGVGSYATHTYENSPELLGSDADIEGNDVDTAPKMLYRFGLDWDYGRGAIHAGWNAVGRYYLEPENEHEYDGHSLLTLAWQYKINEHSDLRLRVANALDEDYAERADFAFGDYRYFPGNGRAIRVLYSTQF